MEKKTKTYEYSIDPRIHLWPLVNDNNDRYSNNMATVSLNNRKTYIECTRYDVRHMNNNTYGGAIEYWRYNRNTMNNVIKYNDANIYCAR